MMNQIIENAIEGVVQEILELNDAKTKKMIQQLKKEGVEEVHIKQIFKFAIIKSMIIEPDSRKDFIYDQLDFVLKQLGLTRKSYRFEAKMITDGYNSTRQFTVPAYFTMADLAYSVMAAFKGEGCHLFSLEYKKTSYTLAGECGNREDCESAEMTELGTLNFRKGSCIRMEYDFGESWEFEIRFIGSFDVDEESNMPVLEDGEGVNLWEDNRYLLHLMHTDPNCDITDYAQEEMTVKQLAELEGIDELTENQIDEFADTVLQLKSQYEDNDYSDELN